MKKLITLFILVSTLAQAQTYKISPWFEGKKSATILTFDDGLPEHPATVIPLLNRYGFKGTFYIGSIADHSWTSKAFLEGHEIGNHSENHKHLLNLNAQELQTEINNFKQTLSQESGAEITTFAYPYGEGSESNSSSFEIQDTVANHHIAGRGVYSFGVTDWVYDFAQTNREYYQIKSSTGIVSNWFSMVDNCIENGGFLPFFYHAVGNSSGFDNISVPDFTTQLDYLKNKGDLVWITTFSNAIKYHRERKGAKLTEISKPFEVNNTWRLNLTDTLNDTVFNFPLSIELQIPSDITAITSVKQNGQLLDYKIEGDTIYFNATPDNGTIDLGILNCEQPIVDLTVLGKDTLCSPDSVVYNLTNDTRFTYTWYKNDSILSNNTSKIKITQSGVYYAKIELNNCPLTLPKRTVLVTGVCGVPQVDFSADNLVQFKNSKITFTSKSSNLNGSEKYYWNFGSDASLSSGYYGPGPIEITYSTSGNKTISLTVEGSTSHITKTDSVLIKDFDACHAFKEDFVSTSTRVFLDGWNDYSFDHHNSAFRITTQDNGGHEWHTLDYFFHENQNIKSINFANTLTEPVIKLRIKATDTCRLWVYLVDENSVTTTGVAMNTIGGLDLTPEYQEFEINTSGLFFNEWNKVNVDSTKISRLRFSINGGFKSFPFTNKYGQLIDKHFVGSVDIDWISIGKSCEKDSLIGNIVLPSTVNLDSTFTVWNHSSPVLTGATYEWNFGTGSKDSLLIAQNENPIKNSYSSAGKKTIRLKITTADNKVIEIKEYITVIDKSVNAIERHVDGFDNVFTNYKFTNPIHGSITGSLQSKNSLVATISLMDIQQRILYSDEMNFTAGTNQIEIPIENLSPGYYILNISTVKGFKTFKLIKTND